MLLIILVFAFRSLKKKRKKYIYSVRRKKRLTRKVSNDQATIISSVLNNGNCIRKGGKDEWKKYTEGGTNKGHQHFALSSNPLPRDSSHGSRHFLFLTSSLPPSPFRVFHISSSELHSIVSVHQIKRQLPCRERA